MKKLLIKICLVLGFLFAVEDVANAFPGATEYNYKYNKIDYMYIMPTYTKSWATDAIDINYDSTSSFVGDYDINSKGIIIGYTSEWLGLEFEYQKDNYNITPHSDDYYNIETDGYEMKFTLLFQIPLNQGTNWAFAPYIGTGLTYSNLDYSYTHLGWSNNIYDYEENISGFGWQAYKLGTKICYRHLIADVGFDFILGFGAISKGNLYMSLGARF